VPSPHLTRLAPYHQKRDFGVTSEPHGEHAAHTTVDRFVIPDHAARRRLPDGPASIRETVPRRPQANPDPWAAMATTRQTLRARALDRLVRLSQR
jgi:hypothetical protein